MMKYFPELSTGDKNRLMLLFIAVVIALYFGIWYQQSSSDLMRAENLVNRRLDRIEKRAKPPELSAIPVKSIERELAQLDQVLEFTNGELNSLKSGFVSLENPTDLQTLRLEVSELARASGVEVMRVSGIGVNAADEVRSISDALALKTDNRFGRPLMSMTARGTFNAFLSFLDGLEDLSKHVVVVRVALSANQSGAEDPTQLSTLNADLVFAM